MANFKAGQRVVYIGPNINDHVLPPKTGEIVTLGEKSITHKFGWYLLEYPYGKNFTVQSFSERSLRPLQSQYTSIGISSELAKDFVLTQERIEITKKELA